MITVRNLVKRYGRIDVVRSISFDVKRGQIFAFLGPNGAGKTTVIKMLTTLLTPSSGSILIDGHDVVSERAEVRRRFGIIFQDPSLDVDLSAIENMDLHGVLYGLPSKQRSLRIEHLLKLFDLWDCRKQMITRLSGGMKRRLEIARGLIHMPKVLFLDEPTLGLDPQSRSTLWSQIQTLNSSENVTVFLTTHYMDEAQRLAHTVAVIDRGALVAQGSTTELIAQTNSESLEQAFLALTHHSGREAGYADQPMRQAINFRR